MQYKTECVMHTYNEIKSQRSDAGNASAANGKAAEENARVRQAAGSSAARALQIDIGAVLEPISEGIVVVDDCLNLMWSNEAAQKYISRFDNIVPKNGGHAGRIEIANFIRRVLKTGKKSTMISSQTLDGKTGYIEITAYKTGLGATITIIDITERQLEENSFRDSEQSLRSLMAFKDKFFSLITNDIKQPLAAFIGLTNVLVMDFKSLTISEMAGMANLLFESSSSLNKLFENLLDWAVMQNERLLFNPEKIYLSEIVDNNLKLLSIVAGRKEIAIENRIDAGACLNVDLHLLNTVLRNLITNAIKYTHPGGRVRICSVEEDDYVSIIVVDNGVGMNKGDIASLFDMKKKNPAPGTANEQGAGLGLVLCKELLDRYGADIIIESRKNTGTRATIRFNKVFHPLQ